MHETSMLIPSTQQTGETNLCVPAG